MDKDVYKLAAEYEEEMYPIITFANQDACVAAYRGFRAGYFSRDDEVDLLKEEIKNLKEQLNPPRLESNPEIMKAHLAKRPKKVKL